MASSLCTGLGCGSGALIFGLNAAYGIWWWNASIDVEDMDVRTAWTVTDDPLGEESYETRIKLFVPREADAEILAVADNERVVIKHTRRLECTDDGIEAQVQYQVRPQDGARSSCQILWKFPSSPIADQSAAAAIS